MPVVCIQMILALLVANIFVVVVYHPSKESEDPSALLHKLIPQSYIDLEEAVRSKAAEMKLEEEMPILTQKQFL